MGCLPPPPPGAFRAGKWVEIRMVPIYQCPLNAPAHLSSAAQPFKSTSLFSFIDESLHTLTQWRNQDKSSGSTSIALPQFHLLQLQSP